MSALHWEAMRKQQVLNKRADKEQKREVSLLTFPQIYIYSTCPQSSHLIVNKGLEFPAWRHSRYNWTTAIQARNQQIYERYSK